MSSSPSSTLTAAQQEAVHHVAGPLLILAGPGSGKTRVVTHRIAHLLTEGIPSSQILALTFTNKAADEMRQRLQKLAPGESPWMGTFHRFGAFLLRRYADRVGLRENFSIGDVDDSKRILKSACEDARVDLEMTSVDSIAHAISWAKNNLITPEQYQPRAGSVVGALTAKIYPVYQQRMLRANLVDFDDLLLHVATLLRENAELRASLDRRYRFVMVDEYQDTNLAQYAIVRALSIDHPNLAVTGDPDQSIYGWRGANLSNILDFERDFANVKVVRLEQNYRSTQRILRVADQLISHNTRRKPKELFTENAAGLPVRLIEFPTQQDEAEQIATKIRAEVRAGRRNARDFAIFYRVNALTRSLEKALREQGVGFQIVHGIEFYQRKEVRDLIAYLQLVNNPSNDAALLRVINVPPRGIGATTIERLREFASVERLPLIEVARRAGMVPGLKSRAAVAVARFVAVLDGLREMATKPVADILERLLDTTGYRESLEKSQTPEDDERLANIEELVSDAHEFDQQHPHEPPLEPFLEQTALVNDTDDLAGDVDCVTLMTLHAAKGLEFPVVFIVGVEQGLIPHERSRQDDDQLEEERRLLFVGITRAEEELQLSYCQQRFTHGVARSAVPSQFLMELPRGEMEVVTASHGRMGVDFNDHDFDLPPDDEFPVHQMRDTDDDERDDAEEFASSPPQRRRNRDEEFADDPFDESTDSESVPSTFRNPRATRPAPAAVPRREHAVLKSPNAGTSSATGAAPTATSAAMTTDPLAALAGKLRTGAELAAGGGTARPERGKQPAGAFTVGMAVTHPEYGLGRIVQITGADQRRTATVQFAELGLEKSFRLAFSPLRPA